MHSLGRQCRHIRCGAFVCGALRLLQEASKGLHGQPLPRCFFSLPVAVRPPPGAFAAFCLRRRSIDVRVILETPASLLAGHGCKPTRQTSVKT